MVSTCHTILEVTTVVWNKRIEIYPTIYKDCPKQNNRAKATPKGAATSCTCPLVTVLRRKGPFLTGRHGTSYLQSLQPHGGWFIGASQGRASIATWAGILFGQHHSGDAKSDEPARLWRRLWRADWRFLQRGYRRDFLPAVRSAEAGSCWTAAEPRGAGLLQEQLDFRQRRMSRHYSS